MRGASAARIVARPLVLLLGAALLAPAAHAVTAFDGRLEVHGYYEAQIRSIARDFQMTDGWDLTQWWNILSIEIEANVAPDGWGPFDVISVFGRIEVRYDCVWTGGCSMFDSANTYSYGRYGKLPKRLSDAKRTGYQGTLKMGDERHFYDVPYTEIAYAADDRRFRPDGERQPMRAYQTPFLDGFFGGSSYGLDGIPYLLGEETGGDEATRIASTDDPPWTFFHTMLQTDCDRWGARKRAGTQNGRGDGDTLLLSPDCNYEHRSAPRRTSRTRSARTTSTRSSTATARRRSPTGPRRSTPPTRAPTRCSPEATTTRTTACSSCSATASSRVSIRTSRAASWPGTAARASSEQKELKELYVDFEMFDSRLWVRAGYQTIVWGKTELFRNQDQFNPQDVALASLPSLEESRISLWAIRAIWSFYDVGPLNDVRLELAMNFDQYQPIDPGVCGEPYAPLAVCQLTSGPDRPRLPRRRPRRRDPPARPVERLQRASSTAPASSSAGTASASRITDFYGFQDFPYVDALFSYSRNVDPISGRPRHTMTTGRCRTGHESACLDSDKALTEHSVNQQLFSAICFNTLAVAPTLDPTACLANIFGSPNRTDARGRRPRRASWWPSTSWPRATSTTPRPAR